MTADRAEAPGDRMQQHRLCNTKYGSKQLVPMTTILAKSIVSMSKGQGVKIQALADSGSSASIISLELAIKLDLEREDPGNTKLTDASGANMDVTAVATVAVREMEGIPSCFQVLVSTSVGKDEMVVGIDDLKTYTFFTKTSIPEYRRTYMGKHVCLQMPVEKDEEKECEKERASGVLLYLEDRFNNNNMDNRIKNLEKFPVVIQDVLNRYSNVFNTTIKKTMKVPDAELNLVDGYRPTRCYTTVGLVKSSGSKGKQHYEDTVSETQTHSQ